MPFLIRSVEGKLDDVFAFGKTAHASFSVKAGKVVVTDRDGNVVQEEPQKHIHDDYLNRCDKKIDDDIVDALYYFAQETSWYTLYKAYETIKLAVDDHLHQEASSKKRPSKIANKWAAQDELNDFTNTANNCDFYFKGLGRHSRRKSSPKRKPITLAQGEDLIRRLLIQWLKSA